MHIQDKNLIPEKTMPVSHIEGVEVKRSKPIDLLNLNHVNPIDALVYDVLSNQISDLTMNRGIHPGYISILFQGQSEDLLFPRAYGGLQMFEQSINQSLKSNLVASNAMYSPQVTTLMDESIHFKHNDLEAANRYTTQQLVTDKLADATKTIQNQCDNHPQVMIHF